MSKNVSTFEVEMEQGNLSKAKAKEIRQLCAKKNRDEKNLFLIEGEKCVRDTIDAFDLENLICTRSWLEENPKYAQKYSEKLLISDHRGMEIISSMASVPEVIAVCVKPHQPKEFSSLDDKKLYVVLDEIQDPGNLGTIIRTCDWFGVYEIFASLNTADVYSPKVVQASMGSLSRVRVYYTDLFGLFKSNPGINVIGGVLNGRPLQDYPSGLSGFLVLGNEGRGISDKIRELIDLPVTIPPRNPEVHPDSLNVAVSAAILLSHFSEIIH